MDEYFETIIIGGGQAGLALAYYLAEQERDFVILEKAANIAPAWRTRWDSFTLVLPNWTLQMPGFPYHGDNPDGFLTRDEMVSYLEQYAATIDFDIRFNTQVTSLELDSASDRFLVSTNGQRFTADNVVVATGTYQSPKIPAISGKISKDVTQLHTSQYHNPDELPSGAVLVVGSGQSGCQIAEELYQSGRKVYLCVGRAKRLPRFYRGRDMVWWLDKVKFFDQTSDSLPSPKARFEANPFLSGKDGGHSLDLHQFARDGVILLGRLQDAQDTHICLAPDLRENLAAIDQFVEDVTDKIDGFIAASGIPAEPETGDEQLTDGYDGAMLSELDLRDANIHAIIWATGYHFDYSWVKFPVLDEYGYPIQKRGVCEEVPGLYFLGLHWLYKRRSGLPWGVGEDAAYLAEQIVHRAKEQVVL